MNAGAVAKTRAMGGAQFESEIREQPAVLTRLASSPLVQRLENAIGGRDVVFTGSGSSLFVAQLAALAWRRSGRRASAIAASEAGCSGSAQRDACVIALSQSGRTRDVLDAVDALDAVQTVALTNDGSSPLAQRANATIDVGAGAERAVPASKSVTAMAALLLAAASSRAHSGITIGRALVAAAVILDAWLRRCARDDGRCGGDPRCAAEYHRDRRGLRRSGRRRGRAESERSDVPPCRGVWCGRIPARQHGDARRIDRAHRDRRSVVARGRHGCPRNRARGRCRYPATFGAAVDGIAAFGPPLEGIFAPLGWIVTGQVLALAIARRAGIDSDTPRGLRKFLG